MAWTTKRTIKKMAVVKFNKSNNWTVNLNQLGLGLWDKNKIRYISGISKLNMYKYDMGYDISVSHTGVTEPIYSCNLNITRASDNVVTNRQTSCPSTLTIDIAKDTAYVSTVHFAMSRSHSIFISMYVNGGLWYNIDINRAQYHEEFRLIPINPQNSYKIELRGSGDSYNIYRAIINQYKVKTERDLESEVTCLFLEED